MNNPNLPPVMDDLIDDCEVLKWKDIKSLRTLIVQNKFREINPDLMCFCQRVYRDIQHDVNEIAQPVLLSSDECEKLDAARRNITHFWNDDVGERIYMSKSLKLSGKYGLTDKDLKARVLRVLPFLEISLARELNSNYLGAEYLFRLSCIGLKKSREEMNGTR